MMNGQCNEPAVTDVLYLTDSYKITHHNQYPPNTTHVYSYFESRGGELEETCFFGLQYIIKRWLCGRVVKLEDLEEAKDFYKRHFNQDVFNEDGWRYIAQELGGRLPLVIKAVPEGTVVPTHNVLFTVENTDPKVPWLTNWFETILVQCWYPVTVCSISREHKKLIAEYMTDTCDTLDGIEYKLHDFGYRGCSSVESASIGDAAHLVNFWGTDTIAGLRMCEKYYSCPMAGYSIPAAEHSTITSWGRDGESAAFSNILRAYPTGAVSVVSDSYDLFKAIENIWGKELKTLVQERDGTLVIRPDSGDPIRIVVQVLEKLSESFGFVTNSKGYKELPKYLRVIQGDGIDLKSCRSILEAMKTSGWSAANITFGEGGALIQRLHRDTLKCAFKCSNVVVAGENQEVFKDPATDHGKKSKKGRLTLEMYGGSYRTVQEGKGEPDKDCLVPVFKDGQLLVDYTLTDIRKRANQGVLAAV